MSWGSNNGTRGQFEGEKGPAKTMTLCMGFPTGFLKAFTGDQCLNKVIGNAQIKNSPEIRQNRSSGGVHVSCYLDEDGGG